MSTSDAFPEQPNAESATASPLGSPDETMRAASSRLASLEEEGRDLKDKWLRAEAELANLRARTKRELEDMRQYAVQKFATDVVEAAENIRRGLDNLPAGADGEPAIVTKLRDGFEGVERSFLSLLERNGIKREDPTGATFDAKLHQAMAEQPSDHPPGTVIKAWSPTWTLHGRLLRPAMVVVAKSSDASA